MHHEMLLRFAVVLPNKKRQANGSSDGSCCYIRMHCVLLNKQKMSPDPPYKQKTRSRVVEDAYNDDLFSEQHKGELQEA